MIGEIDRLPWYIAWLGDPLSWALIGIVLLGAARWLWRRAVHPYVGRHR